MTAGLMAIAACELRGPSASPGGAGDRLPPNAACYICHMPLMKDTITKTHAKAGITCTRCHGLSAAHANDEKIGATPPDRKFRNGEGIAFCRTCHKTHDVAPEAVVQRYRQRVAAAPAATQPTASIACTQCHGAHRLLRQAATQPTSSEK
jgi:hypothetical protein